MDGTGQYGGTNTQNVFSGSIWGDCPVTALRDKQVSGAFWEKNFNTVPGGSAAIPTTEGMFGDIALFSSTGGTCVNDTTEVGGGLAMGSDGDNEGAGIRSGGAPFKIILTGGDFWAEWRMLTSTIADAKHNIWSGLMADTAITATVPITAAGALADTGLVGFQRPETAKAGAGTGGATLNAMYKASGVTAVTVQADAGTLVAATYTNLGLKFIPKRNVGKGAGYLLWFQDGVQVASKLIPSAAGTDFPNNVPLGFVFSVLNSTGTTPGTSTIKHVRMAQLLTAIP